jgi:hypothetical protein
VVKTKSHKVDQVIARQTQPKSKSRSTPAPVAFIKGNYASIIVVFRPNCNKPLLRVCVFESVC